jgi:condensin complex subunit 2
LQDASKSARLLTPPEPETKPEAPEDDPTHKFTSVMNGLQTVYAKPVMDDISTSFGFICLLHLANEKGLVIDSSSDLMELNIRKIGPPNLGRLRYDDFEASGVESRGVAWRFWFF